MFDAWSVASALWYDYLSNRHPLEIRPYSVHLPLIDTNSAIFLKRLFRIVKARRSISIPVI